jgi:hypothetical protein
MVPVAKKPGPVDERLQAAITAALQVRNGRSHIVGSYAELVKRLNEDGVQFTPKDLYITWAALLKLGTVARRPGIFDLVAGRAGAEASSRF